MKPESIITGMLGLSDIGGRLEALIEARFLSMSQFWAYFPTIFCLF